MKRKAMFSTLLVVTILYTCLWSATASATDVILNPGYITGQASVGTEGYKVRNLSLSASGGGYSASKSVSQTYAEPIVPLEYSMTVQGGDWDTQVSATATASPVGSYYPYTNIYFSPRTLTVPATDPPTTVGGNDYSTDATVQFQLSFTTDSDPFDYWYAYGYAYKSVASGLEQTNSRGYQYSYYCIDVLDCSWKAPIVSNDQVRIYARIYVYDNGSSKRYDFWINNPDLRYEDISPGEALIIPLEVTHTAPLPGTGSVEGTVELGLTVDGVDYGNSFSYPDRPYSYHYVSGYSSNAIYSNPGDYAIDNVPAGVTYTYNARSYLYDRLSEQDPWRQLYLYWPYTDGDYQNNQITLSEGEIAQKDFYNDTGILTGEVKLTGTLRNEDLDYYQLQAYGSRYYELGLGWINDQTYGGNAYDQVYSSDLDQSYRLFLTPGLWQPYILSTYTNDSDLLGYANQSGMTVYDYKQYYDGSYYDFGAFSEIVAGTTTAGPDHDYCTGSVIIRFRVAGDSGQLRNPYVNGYAYVYNDDDKRELQPSVWGRSYPPATVSAPEVEVHGIPADYDLSYIRAYTEDGTQVRFPNIPVTLECGVRKGRDLTGPNIAITHPPADPILITSSTTVSVVGTVSDDTGVETVTVNDESVLLMPTENPDMPNEVAFTHDLTILPNGDIGEQLVSTWAADPAGNEAFDERTVLVDRVAPSVALSSPPDGKIYPQIDGVIPVGAVASDLGYGNFTLEVTLDGETGLGSAEGTADEAPIAVNIANIGPLAGGQHIIEAVATDAAGNAASDQRTVRVDSWIPTVEIKAPASGSFHSNLQTIPVKVEASDQGYGFSLTVSLDGTSVHEATGPANIEAPESILFDGSVGPLDPGDHVLSSVVTDLAGNSQETSVTLTSYLEAAYVEAKPESRNGNQNGKMTIFAQLPQGLTQTASLVETDYCELSSGSCLQPVSAKYDVDGDKLLLKFNRSVELMADTLYVVRGSYCPSPGDCYTWQGMDETKH